MVALLLTLKRFGFSLCVSLVTQQVTPAARGAESTAFCILKEFEDRREMDEHLLCSDPEKYVEWEGCI